MTELPQGATTLSYLAAHRDAIRRLAAGEQQIFCQHCRRWHWATAGCPEAYAAALRVVARIDRSLRSHERQALCVIGPAIYRRRSDGRLLSHLDEVIRAILEGDLAEPGKARLF